MGHCDSVYLTEVGDTQVVVFKHGILCYFSLISLYVIFVVKFGSNAMLP